LSLVGSKAEYQRRLGYLTTRHWHQREPKQCNLYIKFRLGKYTVLCMTSCG